MNDVCLQCGETRDVIKREKLFCATVSNTEAGMETDQEWDRHRFKPYSEKELAARAREEEEYIRHLGDFADFVRLQEELERQPCVQFDK